MATNGKGIGILLVEQAAYWFKQPLYIQPEGEEKIDNQRGSKGEKRQINKINPDPGTRNPNFITNVGTNAKGRAMNEVFRIHNSKIIS